MISVNLLNIDMCMLKHKGQTKQNIAIMYIVYITGQLFKIL